MPSARGRDDGLQFSFTKRNVLPECMCTWENNKNNKIEPTQSDKKGATQRKLEAFPVPEIAPKTKLAVVVKSGAWEVLLAATVQCSFSLFLLAEVNTGDVATARVAEEIHMKAGK